VTPVRPGRDGVHPGDDNIVAVELDAVLEHADVTHYLAALEPHERLGHVLPHEAVRGDGGNALGQVQSRERIVEQREQRRAGARIDVDGMGPPGAFSLHVV
jgi:hypothetical protein